MRLNLNDFEHTTDGYTLQTAYGLTVHIGHDPFAENPFTVEDCEPPTLWAWDTRLSLESAWDCESFFSRVSAPWVSRHWREICELLGLDPAEHDEEAKRQKRGWPGGSLSEIRADLLAYELRILQPESYHTGTRALLDALHGLYGLAKTPALRFTRRGYSQGSVISGLVILTPEWCESVGYTSDGGDSDARQMEAAADLLAAWAFGDVYGFAVSDDSGDYLDSCGSFYGDPEESGVLDAAANALQGCLSTRLATLGAELAAAARFAAGLYYPAA